MEHPDRLHVETANPRFHMVSNLIAGVVVVASIVLICVYHWG